MRNGDPFEGLICKPANSVKFPWHQQAGIHRNSPLFSLLVQGTLQLIWSELITFVSN